MRVQRGHQGVHYIVQFNNMGRKHMRAHGTVESLKHMIGKPYGLDGEIIGVVELGRPVKDNEPPTYKANKPKATMKRDNLPSCVKRHTSVDVSIEPPPLKPVKQIGYQPCTNAAVARGEATELSYAERKANALKFRPAAVYPQQSSVSEPVSLIHHEWMAILNREPERIYDLNYFTPQPIVKRWHGLVVDEVEVERMDRDQFPVAYLAHVKGRCKGIEQEWFNMEGLDRDFLNTYVAPLNKTYHVLRVESPTKEDIFADVKRLLAECKAKLIKI